MTIELQQGRLRQGVWEAVLSAAARPAVAVLHRGDVLPGTSLDALAGRPGAWLLRVPVPPDRLDDGVQTFVVQAEEDGRTLGHFSIVAGAPLDADLRAEIDLLRAEIDLLKRSFRRHLRPEADPGAVTPRSA